MSVICPAGHQSTSTDYCDTCGTPIEAATAPVPVTVAPPGPTQTPAPRAAPPCPNCGAARQPEDAFCEVCGLDFATGQMPAPAPPTPAAAGVATGWVVVVEADRSFFDTNESPEAPVPFPRNAAAREVPLSTEEAQIGRRSDSRGIFPDVEIDDPGVSRRHAALRRKPDGSWVLVDNGSTNGTFVGGTAVRPGVEVALAEGQTVNLGAWTRLTLKKA